MTEHRRGEAKLAFFLLILFLFNSVVPLVIAFGSSVTQTQSVSSSNGAEEHFSQSQAQNVDAAKPTQLEIPRTVQHEPYRPWFDRFLGWVRENFQLSQSASMKYRSMTDTKATVQNVPVTINQDQAAVSLPYFGNKNDVTYFDPSVSSLGDGWEYKTSFGFYLLTPTPAKDNIVVTYRSLNMTSTDYIVKAVFQVLENSQNGKWKPFNPADLSANPTSISGTRFQETWDLSQPSKDSKVTVAQVVFTVDFGKTSLPKLSVQMSKLSYQVDPNCVSSFETAFETACETWTYWDDVGLKDFQWFWVLSPASAYDKFASKKQGTVALSSISNDQSDDIASSVSFNGWGAEWNVKGKKPVQLVTAHSLLNSKPALIIQFDLNDGNIDPTLGITSTGSTSYPSTTITYYSQSNADGHNDVRTGYITSIGQCIAIGSSPFNLYQVQFYLYRVGSPSGTSTANLYAATGTIGTNATPTGSVLATSATVAVSTISTASSFVTFTFGTSYFLATSTNYCIVFTYTGGNATNYIGFWFDTSSPTDPGNYTDNYGGTWRGIAGVDAIYYLYGQQIKGYTKGTRVQYTGTTGAPVSSFSFYTHTGSASDHFTSAFYSDFGGNDANTVLLLPMQGVDASTTFTNVSASAHTLTANDNAQIDTAQSKFGGASGLFDGAGDYLSTPDSADWAFGSGDFTIDFWVRRDGTQADYACLIAANDQAHYTGWTLDMNLGADIHKLRWITTGSGSYAVDITASSAIADATWTHVAIVRYGNTVTMYLNGVSVGSKNVTGWTINSSGTGLVVARQFTDIGGYYYKGWIDELRISKGVARWTSNFTPPTAPYGEPYQRLWYSASTGSASSTWNTVNYASGTTDNSWAGALTQNAYYWFMWQWDNPDSGPSYAAGSANTGIYKVQTYGTLDSTWSGGTLSTENWSVYLTYLLTYTITWQLSGIPSDASGTILTVDGTTYSYAQFPVALDWLETSTHTVAATTPISAGTGKQYVWTSWTNGDGLSGSSGTYTTPSGASTVTVNYKTQYQVSFTSSGIGSDTGSNTIVTVASNNYQQSQLPYTAWYDSSSSLAYSFASPVASTGKRYPWASTSGLSQTLQSNSFSVTATGTVTGFYNTQYNLKLQAVDGYTVSMATQTILKTSVASATVNSTTLTADANGYMDFGWYDSGVKVNIVAKYRGTVVNSTWQSSLYTISSLSVYQWQFEYQAYLSTTVAVPSDQAADSTVWNFTSYHVNTNSSATLTSGTVYVYYANPTAQVASGSITSSSKAVTATGYSLPHGASSVTVNVTDGYVWIRSTQSITFTVSIQSLISNVDPTWIGGTQKSISYAFQNIAQAAGTYLTLKKCYSAITVQDASGSPIYSTQTTSVFNATANAQYSSSLYLTMPSTVLGGAVVRVAVYQSLLNGTAIALGYVDQSITVSVPQQGIQGNYGLLPTVVSMTVQPVTYTVRESEQLNGTVRLHFNHANFVYDVDDIQFSYGWVKLLDKLPIHTNQDDITLHVQITGPYLHLNATDQYQFIIYVRVIWSLQMNQITTTGPIQVNITPMAGAALVGPIQFKTQIVTTVAGGIAIGIGTYIARKKLEGHI